MRRITVALIGQPNVGKSTLFNVLTHGHVIVTNWPGTTVEKSEGHIDYNAYKITLVDLPGVYGLTGLTLEEKISKDFILRSKPDVVVVLVDSLSLERTLYLALEVLELTSRVVIAVTKVDEAHSRGIHINYELLEKALKVPIVPISAIKGIGVKNLLEKIVSSVDTVEKPFFIDYGELEPFINAVALLLRELEPRFNYPIRWSAIKILEGDEDLSNELKNIDLNVYRKIEEVKHEARRRFGQNLAVVVSKRKFEFISSITRNAVVRIGIRKDQEKRFTQIFYRPYIAPLVSIAILGGIFISVFTINTGYPLTLLFRYIGLKDVAIWLEEHNLGTLIESLLEALANTIYSVLGVSSITQFIVEAILGGVFMLLLFTPLITVVLLVLGIFEDSGLLTRMAVGLHVLLQKVGFSGHSLFPFSLSLGCNVPGLLVTRTSPSAFERLRLLLLTPFIPCQARLIVLLAIASAIGGAIGALIIPLAYILSFSIIIVLNLVVGRLAKRQKGEYTAELLLTLPPMHKPIPKVVWWFTWFYLKHFITKVGTVIVLANIAVWLLSNVGADLAIVSDIGNSTAALVSRPLSWLLKPLGVSGDYSWVVAFALLTGFIAKELFLTTILTITGVESVKEALEVVGLTPSSAAAITIFVTLYVPCIATVSTVYTESKSLKLTLINILLMVLIAYITSIAIYAILDIVT